MSIKAIHFNGGGASGRWRKGDTLTLLGRNAAACGSSSAEMVLVRANVTCRRCLRFLATHSPEPPPNAPCCHAQERALGFHSPECEEGR